MEDTNVELDIEELREFVSPAIFDFLSNTINKMAMVAPLLPHSYTVISVH